MNKTNQMHLYTQPVSAVSLAYLVVDIEEWVTNRKLLGMRRENLGGEEKGSGALLSKISSQNASRL